jgi:hypothetical protein
VSKEDCKPRRVHIVYICAIYSYVKLVLYCFYDVHGMLQNVGAFERSFEYYSIFSPTRSYGHRFVTLEQE